MSQQNNKPAPRSRLWPFLKGFGISQRLLRWVEGIQQCPRTTTHLCELIDAKYGIPRPASSPHLTPYHAMIYLMGVAGSVIGILLAGLVSAYLIFSGRGLLVEILSENLSPMDEFW